MIKFLYPLGLLGLIGIPVVIIIYLLKNKYTEKVITSTYIWNLSEKFLKKKNPLHKINGLLSLILQIVSILVLSLCIARPIITIKDQAKNYLFIIDASSSMNIKSNDKSRFERGIDEISKIVDASKNGSYYSLIYGTDNSTLLLNKVDDKEKVYFSLKSLSTTQKSFLMDNAINLAQQYYYDDSSYDVYLITDKDYMETNNVTIINVSDNEINSAICSLNVAYSEGNIKVIGNVITYGSDLNVKISLLIDDEFYAIEEIETINGIESNFSFTTDKQTFNKIEAKIVDDDSLSLDNNYILYNNESTNEFKTLIVSDQPTFLNNVLKVLGNKQVNVCQSSEYNETKNGFSLYVFDNFTPNTLPSDGAIWLFKTNKNILNSGFIVQNEVNLSSGGELSLKKSNSETYKSLSKNIIGKDIYVSKYQKYTLYNDATILFEYNNDPMVFALLNDYNNREIVFSFDLHDSNFTLQLDFVPLFSNLVNYSIPTMIEKSTYEIGETLNINVLPFTESIRVNYPSKMSKYLDLSTSTLSLELTEIGSYQIIALVNNVEKEFNIFVSHSLSESKTNVIEDSMSLIGETNKKSFDEQYDTILILAILVLVVLTIDWGVYIYEQR